MFKWNELKIYVEDENNIFIEDIENYFYLDKSEFIKEDSDIIIYISYLKDHKNLKLKENFRLIKIFDLTFEKETVLEIYTNEKELLYFFKDTAIVGINLKENRIVMEIIEKYDFGYYNLLYFFLYPLAKLLENFGFYSLHSSSATIEDKAMLFTGKSGSGKSTAAFAIAVSGGNIVSDDLTFVKKKNDSFYIYPLTKLVKLNEGALNEFFPQLLKYKILKSEINDIYIDSHVLNKHSGQPASLSAIAILDKSGKKSTFSSNIHPLKTVPHLFPSSINTNIEEITKRKFDFITDLLENTSCYNIEFGIDMKDFYRNIKNILF